MLVSWDVQEETDVYIGEVEQIGAAYEDMMGQNNRLLAQLADNDRVNSEIVAERVKVSDSCDTVAGCANVLACHLDLAKWAEWDDHGKYNSSGCRMAAHVSTDVYIQPPLPL
jgi:hypothetical protein